MVAEIAAARRRLSSSGGHVTVDHESRGSRPGSAGSSGENVISSMAPKPIIFRWIKTGSKNTEKSCNVSYYIQFSYDIKCTIMILRPIL